MIMGRYALALLLFALTAHSTIVRVDDLPEMAQNSEVIAHVVVGDKTTSFDREGRIVELTTVQVLQGIKGTETGHFLTLYQVSGIIGQSTFDFGEEMVIFGMRLGDKVVSYGVGLGKFKVLRAQSRTSIVEDYKDLLTIRADHTLGEPKARHYASLPSFIQTIEAAVKAPWKVVPTGPKAVRRK